MKKDICFVANNTFHIPDRIEAYKYSKKYLLFVGTIRKRKQLDLCIDAFIKVNNSLEDKINFIIIGDGPEKKVLENQIKTSKNYDFIKFVGQVNDPAELEGYYKSML